MKKTNTHTFFTTWTASSGRRWRSTRQSRSSGAKQDGGSLICTAKKEQLVGWTLNFAEWELFKKWPPGASGAHFLLAQETHLPKDAVTNEGCGSMMACLHPSSALYRSPQHGDHGCSGAAAWSRFHCRQEQIPRWKIGSCSRFPRGDRAGVRLSTSANAH